jgi:hypothetical protein
VPWTAKDASAHTKKADTEAKKRKWAAIANATLESCQKSGGGDCEGKAIRVANSKMSEEISMPTTQKIPKGALRFVEPGCHAYLEFADDGKGEQKPSRINMVGYSGGVIKDHWWWGNLSIDLAGMEFSQKRYPILENHNDSLKIAHMSKPEIKDGKLMAPEDTQFVDTPAAQEFIKLSKDGFPYQSSISAKPTVVERVEEGAFSEVNGYKFKGPGSIWRKSTFREMSVCVFGWDSKTSASAFSHDVTEDVEYTEERVSLSDQKTNEGEEVKEVMDLKELREKHPNLFTEIIELGKQGAVDALSTSIKSLTDSVAAMATSLKKVEEDNQKLSQELKDKELTNEVDLICSEKLSSSNIPKSLHKKVRDLVPHSKFMKDGVLDREAFGKALDSEIVFWGKLKLSDSQEALGLGSTGNEIGAEDAAKQNKETLQAVNELRQLVGLTAVDKI